MRDFNETTGSVDSEKTKPTHRVVMKLAKIGRAHV